MTDALVHGRARNAHRAVVETPADRSGPLVLVLHEAWGLTGDIVDTTQRLARAGFVAVAPDLLTPAGGSLRAVAQSLWGAGPALGAAIDTIDWAQGIPEVSGHRVGVVGFSMGGTLALSMGRHPAVAAISANYCLPPLRWTGGRHVPVLATFGGADRILPGNGRRLARRLEARGVDHRVHVHSGARHSFMTPLDVRMSSSRLGRALRLEHDQLAARAAWRDTIAFLHAHLPAG